MIPDIFHDQLHDCPRPILPPGCADKLVSGRKRDSVIPHRSGKKVPWEKQSRARRKAAAHKRFTVIVTKQFNVGN
jgi:hypothetical protein